MKAGIKQGAVESPSLFAVLAELCFAVALQRFSWHTCSSKLPGLNLRDILLIDDNILHSMVSNRYDILTSC